MHKLKVGVLRGGKGSERKVSFNTGANVLAHLPKEKYVPIDIFVDQSGAWHINGIPKEPHEARHNLDVIFNALHGTYGEDGKVQQLLESLLVPYTGSGISSSAVSMNKILTKDIVRGLGIKVPYHIVITKSEHNPGIYADIFRRISLPVIIKPVFGGSSLSTFLIKDVSQIFSALERIFEEYEEALVEEYILGREATIGLVNGLRGQKIYKLFPIEIISRSKSGFFDYEAKYDGLSEEICPGRFSPKERKELEEIATLIHKTIGLRHYSRSDFILSSRGIYFLEVNALPGLTKESLVPRALKSAGVNMPEFLDHVVSLAYGGM